MGDWNYMQYLNWNSWCANLSEVKKTAVVGKIIGSKSPVEVGNIFRSMNGTVGYFVYLYLSKNGYWMHPRSLN